MGNTNTMNPNDPNPSYQPKPPLDQRAAELANDAKQAIQETGTDLKEKASGAAAIAGEKLSDLGSKIGHAASDLRDKVGEKLSDLREGASDLYSSASSKVRTFGEDSVEYARENPVSTVLTAFAAGILIGYTLRR